jgi:dTDP-L-rhamnose 4-epimerase
MVTAGEGAPRRVVVTGGAGFIGSHVVDELVARGCEITVLDDLHPAAHAERPAYLNELAKYVWGDVRDAETVERCVRGADAVAHHAAMVGLGVDFEDVVDYVSHNATGTAVLLRALHRTRFQGRLVLASSMVVYGEGAYRCPEHGPVRPGPRDQVRLDAGLFDPPCPGCGRDLEPEPVTEESALDPRNIYSATKAMQEHLCRAFAREHGVALTILRYHNVYGPRMPRDTPYAGVASIFRSALGAGRAPEVFEDGHQRRDFVHVRDVARANLLALLTGDQATGTFNVASGSPHTVRDLAETLADAFPQGPRPQVTGRYRLGDVRHVFASTERVRRSLGFRAAIPFADGVSELARASLRAPVS